jgi:hypothetical protein
MSGWRRSALIHVEAGLHWPVGRPAPVGLSSIRTQARVAPPIFRNQWPRPARSTRGAGSAGARAAYSAGDPRSAWTRTRSGAKPLVAASTRPTPDEGRPVRRCVQRPRSSPRPRNCRVPPRRDQRPDGHTSAARRSAWGGRDRLVLGAGQGYEGGAPLVSALAEEAVLLSRRGGATLGPRSHGVVEGAAHR